MPQISTSEVISLDKLGENIDIPIRYSNRTNRIAIKISYKGVELVLPKGHYQAGYKFLLEKEFWVRKKMQNLINRGQIEKNTLPILDKLYLLNYISGSHNEVLFKDNIVNIYSCESKHKEILIKFLYNKLLFDILEIALPLSKKYNLNFTEIKIMDNKGKWGSCSSKAVLSFHWRLAFVPPKILKYLVVHEMCHILEMNHSRSFWNLVLRHYPDYKAAKLWLKENTYRLHSYLL